jgi:2-dehydropantoate 2-reductase
MMEMAFQQVIILGAGALGSVYGAALSSKNDVVLIGRPKHIDAIHKQGLILDGDFRGTYHVKAHTNLKEIPHGTLLIVSTKAFDLMESLSEIQHLLHKDTVILLVQNGLGIIETATNAIRGNCKIVRSLTPMAAELYSRGKIRVWKAETILGSDPVSQQIAQTFQASGLPVRVSQNFQCEIWKKLVLNCVINPLTAVLKVRNDEIGHPSLGPIREAIIDECIAVANAEGIELESNLIGVVDQTISGFANRSSMLQDLIRGRCTEIDFINGKIVELGKLHGLSTPINECLVHLIHFLELHQK